MTEDIGNSTTVGHPGVWWQGPSGAKRPQHYLVRTHTELYLAVTDDFGTLVKTRDAGGNHA